MNKRLIYLILFSQLNLVNAQLKFDYIENITHSYRDPISQNIYFTSNDSIYELSNFKINSLKKINSLNSFSSYKLLIKDDEIYFVDKLGGGVYKELNENLIRLDHSFKHKNQIAANIFIHYDTIYKFGGYGFFGARNFLTYFSFQTKEWEVVIEDPKSNHPPGLFEAKSFIYKDELYILGGRTIDNSNRNKSIANNEIWKFSFESKKWKKIGELKANELLYNPFDFADNDFFYFINQSKLYKLELDNLDVRIFNHLPISDKINHRFPATNFNDKLIVLINTYNSDKLNADLTLIDKDNSKSTQIKLISTGIDINPIYILILTTLLSLIIVSNKIFKKNNKLFIRNGVLRYRFYKIHLNKDETNFISLLIKKNIVKNSELIELLSNNLESSHKSRVKNSIINDLNNKLSILTKGKYFIQKIQSEEDKRYFNYQIKTLNK